IDLFEGSVQFGSTVEGALTFDDTSEDRISDPQQGSFVSFGSPFGVRLLVGGVPFRLDDYLSVNTLHAGASQYGVLACSGGPACEDLEFTLLLNDPTGSATASDALPLAPPDRRLFEPATFRLAGTFEESQIEIVGSIGTLSEPPGVATPEPDTLFL